MPKKRAHGEQPQEYIPAGNGLASGTYASDDGNNSYHTGGQNTDKVPSHHFKKGFKKPQPQPQPQPNTKTKAKIYVGTYFPYNKKSLTEDEYNALSDAFKRFYKEHEVEYDEKELENKLIENMDDLLEAHPEINFDKYLEISKKGFGKNQLDSGEVEHFFLNHKADFYSLWNNRQEKIAQEELAKFNKLPDDTDFNVRFKGVNSKNYAMTKIQQAFGQISKKEYDKYHSNCQRCAQAFELRMRGYDVMATEYSSDKNDELINNGWGNAMYVEEENGFEAYGYPYWIGRTPQKTTMRPLINTKAKSQKADIERIVKEAGNGARFQCSVEWQCASAHIFNIINDNGVVRFIDSQSGTEDVSYYFDSNMIHPKHTMLMRVDNLKLNKNVNLVAKGV